MKPIEDLRAALADHAPPTEAAFAEDRYPNLRITQAPAPRTDVDALIDAAFAAVAWPEFPAPIIEASQLDSAQRQLAELVANYAVPLYSWAIPQTSWARRRWLGIDPPGVLDREVEYGDGETAPLWRALTELEDTPEADALFETLSVADRLEAWGDLAFGAYRIDPPNPPEAIGDAGREWAPSYADRLVAMFAPDAPHVERDGCNSVPDHVAAVVIGALTGADIPIEERWDFLVPIDLDVIARLPEARREAVLVRGLEGEFPSWAIKRGLPAIERFPSAGVLEHLIGRIDQSFTSLMLPPRRELYARLREAVADRPELLERVDARVSDLGPLPELTCTNKLYVRELTELTEGQRTQLGILAQAWETDDGPIAWENEDGEIEFGEIDFVSAYQIAGPDGEPAFEALLYMDEDGAVCRAGTTNSVAYVCQMGLEWNIDEPTVEALHAILRERPPELERDEG